MLSITQSFCLPSCGRLAVKGTSSPILENAPSQAFSVDESHCVCVFILSDLLNAMYSSRSIGHGPREVIKLLNELDTREEERDVPRKVIK